MTDIKPGDQAQWKWGQGHPSGTVAEVADHGSLSIQTSNGNTITRNADPSNPAVHIQQDSGTDVVKRASELEKLQSDTSQDNSEMSGQTDGDLRKPFPAPRQSAPISRPPDTEQEKEEANLSLEEQRELAEKRDSVTGEKGGQATIHGHASDEQKTESASESNEDLMDLREEVQTGEASPEKQPSVGDKRGRSEEPTSASNEQPATSGSAEDDGHEKDTLVETPEPEAKKARVEEHAEEKGDPELTEPKAKSGETAETSEPPKKKAGRPKKDDTKAAPGERKNSISARTRSKANVGDISI